MDSKEKSKDTIIIDIYPRFEADESVEDALYRYKKNREMVKKHLERMYAEPILEAIPPKQE
jgi:prefoldin subunit 5